VPELVAHRQPQDVQQLPVHQGGASQPDPPTLAEPPGPS
jgi:hypothetical protein